MTGKLGKGYLKDYLDKTDTSLVSFLDRKISDAAEISKVPSEMLKRFLKTARKGKRIRGSLVKLGYELAGGTDEKEILDTSLFLEIFHAGILVHDDFMDQDDLRRGLPSLHKQFEEAGKALDVNMSPLHYGESNAVNIGDVAFFISWQKLLNSDFPKENILKASGIYADYAIRLVYGQILDVTNVSLKSLSKRDILKVLKYKTAEYTGVLPLLVGAALGGLKDKKKLSALKEYGLSFGWAFQIQDDILGMYGKEEKLGKSVGSDLKEGKNTLLMLHLSKHGTLEQREFLREVLGNRGIGEKEVEKMQRVLKEAGSYQYVIDIGWEHVEKGKKIIPQITRNKKQQEILESLIVYMMERVS